MTTFQLLSVGAFLMAYYYFVLRTYNTLGFRMFSLFFFVGLSVCYWWYTDYLDLKSIQQKGHTAEAFVLKKSANSLEVRFVDQSGKSVVRKQTGGISVAEFAAVGEGQYAPILYTAQSDTFYLASSYQRQRQRAEASYILVFPGLLFLIGILSWIFLRKYRVMAHEGTIYEYLTDESGKIVLDDTRNATTKALRVAGTMSKLFQVFQK